jgi:hypothetical protein
MEEESFSCKYAMQPMIHPDLEYKKMEIDLVAAPVVVLIDTIYKDTLFRNTFTKKYDTTFINYGENRLTDYIPPEYVYDLGEHPFDSTEIRAFFDTLDVSAPEMGGKNHLEVSSELTFKDFPLSVVALRPMGIKLDYSLSRWPQTYYAVTMGYNFMNVSKLQSDTTVTWTLGYTHYEKGIVETDSLQVTTFIKVK